MSKISHRSVSPFIQKLRDFLLGRKHVTTHRYEDTIARRTQPLPFLPEGHSHKLSKNYYKDRSPFDSIHPPIEIKSMNKEKSISKGSEKANESVRSTGPIPGKVWHWDHHHSYSNDDKCKC